MSQPADVVRTTRREPLGRPRLHLRETGSTSDRARELAAAGAPHGTLVTATAQTAGRGRHGRRWSTPPGALALSLVLREHHPLLAAAAAVAVAEVAGSAALIRWPNDVLIEGRKVAGILAEARPGASGAPAITILGIGINIAVDPAQLDPALHAVAGTLGLRETTIEPLLGELLTALGATLSAPRDELLARYRERDLLRGGRVGWSAGAGRADGIDEHGRLLVRLAGGEVTVLDGGEVRLVRD